MFQPCLVFLTTENNSNELLLLDFLYNLPFWKNLSTPFIYTHECLSIVSVVCLAILFITQNEWGIIAYTIYHLM